MVLRRWNNVVRFDLKGAQSADIAQNSLHSLQVCHTSGSQRYDKSHVIDEIASMEVLVPIISQKWNLVIF
jgi:hypothetical protein